MKKMKLYEPAEFIMVYLKDRLDFHPIDRHIALHLTCSTREMGVDKDLIALARLCSNNVYLPEGVGCCGFAGDRDRFRDASFQGSQADGTENSISQEKTYKNLG